MCACPCVDEGVGTCVCVCLCLTVCAHRQRAERSGGACVAAALAQHRSLVTAGSAHLKHVQAVRSEPHKYSGGGGGSLNRKCEYFKLSL